MAWTTPKTWTASVFTVSDANVHIRDNFRAIGDAWASYTPSWTSTGTNPTLNNGTLVGTYVEAGKLILVRIELTIGSSTSAGTGNYSFSLPTTAAASAWSCLGSAVYYDSSTSGLYTGSAVRTGSSTATALTFQGATSRWSATVPVAPATGDVISAQLCYEAA